MSYCVTDGDEPAKAPEAKKKKHGAFLRICNTTPKIRLRPHTGSKEVLQDGYRLVLLPKLAFHALWNGHGESFVVPRATTGGAKVALPI